MNTKKKQFFHCFTLTAINADGRLELEQLKDSLDFQADPEKGEAAFSFDTFVPVPEELKINASPEGYLGLEFLESVTPHFNGEWRRFSYPGQRLSAWLKDRDLISGDEENELINQIEAGVFDDINVVLGKAMQYNREKYGYAAWDEFKAAEWGGEDCTHTEAFASGDEVRLFFRCSHRAGNIAVALGKLYPNLALRVTSLSNKETVTKKDKEAFRDYYYAITLNWQ